MEILYVVATPIGNLDDITKRALDTLNMVDIIACEDTRTSGILLNHFHINKKLISYHKFNENERSISLVNELKEGKNIALITDAGCPCISDPGYILVKKCIENNIEVIAIPGVSALITSLMVSGLDTRSFSFYGFLERNSKKEETLKEIKNDSTNLKVIYESPKRLIKTLESIEKILDDPYICVCNDLTKKFERKYYGKTSLVIDELLKNNNYELGEYVIVIEKNIKLHEVKEDSVSIESLLVNEMVKENISLKESITIVSTKYNYKKNDVYQASLNLKKLF